MAKVTVYYETLTSHRGWQWLPDGHGLPVDWTTISNADWPLFDKIKKPFIGRYVALLRVVFKALTGGTDVIVCHGTIAATWLGIFKKIFRFRADILAYAYTLPEWDSFSDSRKNFFRRGAPYIDRFLMFSTLETKRYPELLGVPGDRFDMIHWAMNRPDVDQDSTPLVEGEYISAVGGEGRDYSTLSEAMRSLPDIKLAIVARPENVAGVELPENVELFTNIPYPDAMNILVHSKLTALPLLSSTVPCGHGTLIAGFLLELPTIVTASEAMTDYGEDSVTVLTAKERDPEAMKEAIVSLWNDDELREKLASQGKTFAEQYCGDQTAVRYFRGYLDNKGFLSGN